MKNHLAETGIDASEVAYIGDHVNDLEVLQYVGFSAASANAVVDVKNVVDFSCNAWGGMGV